MRTLSHVINFLNLITSVSVFTKYVKRVDRFARLLVVTVNIIKIGLKIFNKSLTDNKAKRLCSFFLFYIFLIIFFSITPGESEVHLFLIFYN